jgi:elongation factor G
VQVAYGKENLPVSVIHSGDIGTVAKLNLTTTGDTLTTKEQNLTLPMPEYPSPLYRVAVSPKTQSDAAKMSTTLARLCEEDLTLTWRMEPATRQTLLFGDGRPAFDVQSAALSKVPDEYEPAGTQGAVRRAHHQGSQARCNRTRSKPAALVSLGEVHLKVFPIKDEDFSFSNDVFGGAISSSYMGPIEKGIRSVMKDGAVAGYPVHNVGVSITDGKEHPVDSKPIAFEIAGREAFKLAFKDANPVLYEPIMKVTVVVPEANWATTGRHEPRRARVQA